MNLKDIKALIFDIDGVFTNNQLLITENGDLLRTMNTRDGYAVKQGLKHGLHIAVITGGSSKGSVQRLENLGIKEIYSGIQDKVPILTEWMQKHQYLPEDILYMGDDYPDYKVMSIVGIPCCPADADPAIIDLSVYISPFKGGDGCVRDIIEKILLSQGKSMID